MYSLSSYIVDVFIDVVFISFVYYLFKELSVGYLLWSLKTSCTVHKLNSNNFY